MSDAGVPNSITPEFPLCPSRWWPDSPSQMFPYDGEFLPGNCPSTPDRSFSPLWNFSDEATNNDPLPEYSEWSLASPFRISMNIGLVSPQYKTPLCWSLPGNLLDEIEFGSSGIDDLAAYLGRLLMGLEKLSDFIASTALCVKMAPLRQLLMRIVKAVKDLCLVIQEASAWLLSNACTTSEKQSNLDQCGNEQHWGAQVTPTHGSRATVVELEHPELEPNETLEAVDASKSENGIAFSGRQDMTKTLKGKSKIHETYCGHTPTSEAVCSWGSENVVMRSGKQDPTAIKHAQTGKMANAPQSTSAVVFTKRKPPKRKCGISGRIIDLDVLRQYFPMKLEDAAKSLHVSRSTLKRKCRQYDIFRWPSHKQCKLFDRDESEKDAACGTTARGNPVLHPNAAGPSEQQEVNRMLTCKSGSSISQAMGKYHMTVPNNHVYRTETSIMSDSTKGSSRSKTKTASHKLKVMDTGSEHRRGDQPSEILHVTIVPSPWNITIKAVYAEDIIRFDFSSTSGIFKLKEEVAKRLSLETGSFHIKYLDNDNDWILITCDEDLNQCIAICGQQDSNAIRLQIRKTL